MARPKKYIIKLTDDEVKKLKSVIWKKILPEPSEAVAGLSWIWMNFTANAFQMNNAQNPMVSVSQPSLTLSRSISAAVLIK